MSPGFTLFVEVLGTIASIAVILEFFGMKPKSQDWWLIMPLSRRLKLFVMLALVAASLSMSGYGFYRSIHPKIVERVIEKSVDRIVEKIVPQQCPEPVKSKRTSRSGTTINA